MNGVKRNAQSTPANEREALRVAESQDSTPEELEALLDYAARVDRALAKHPLASARLLEQLSHSSDRSTRRNVVRNPNCPLDAMLRLAPQFPGDLLLNQRFEGLLTVEPEAFKGLEEKLLIRLLRYKEVPESYFLWAAEHGSESLKLSVVMNSEAPRSVLERLVKDESADVAAAARYHRKRCPELSAEELEAAFRNEIARLLAEVSPVEAIRLWQLNHIGHGQFPALSPAARLAIIGRGYRSDWLVSDDLECSTFGIEERVKLMLQMEEEYYVNSDHFFQDHRLTTDLLADIARTAEGSVAFVAENANCPQELLVEFSRSSDDWLRGAAAKNPNAPSQILKKLATDFDWDVRLSCLENPRCPPSALKAALEDPDADDDVLYRVVENPNTPAATLTRLAEDDGLVALLVENPSTPSAVIERLAEGQDTTWAAEAVANPSCPVEVLERLSRVKKADCRILNAIGRNPSCPPRMRLDMIRQRRTSFPEAIPHLLMDMGDDVDIELVQSLLDHAEEDDLYLLVRELTKARHFPSPLNENPLWNSERSEAIGILLDYCLRLLPLELRQELADDADRDAVGLGHLLVRLGDDEDAGVRLRARANPYHPDFIRSIVEKPVTSAWFQRGYYPELDRAVPAAEDILFPPSNAKKAVKDTSLVVSVIGLAHESLTAGILTRDAKSHRWQKRWAVARNTSTPPTTLERLTEDAHRAVAAQAADTLQRIANK